MKVWITKYALTKGIYEVEVEGSSSTPSMVVSRQEGTYPMFYHGEGTEWHQTEESARNKANQMVASELISLEKQIQKLRKAKF
jgi:hypothetical protein